MATIGHLAQLVTLSECPGVTGEHKEAKKVTFGQLSSNNSPNVCKCLFPREDNNSQAFA